MADTIRGLTDEQLADYEQRAEQAMLTALESVMNTIAEHLGATRTASALVAAGPESVSPDDLAGITPLWSQAVQDDLLPVVAEVYQDAAGTVHAQLIDAADLPSIPPVTSLASEAYLAQATNTFEEVGADLWETARSELLDGFEQGESIPELRDRLRASAGLTGRTATLVARTQVLDASNAGSYDTARVSGLDLLKGWEATPDARTRDTHSAAGAFYQGDGMIALANPFTVGGFACERPHDPVLPPAERYNCRCTLIYAMAPAVPAPPPKDRSAEIEALPSAVPPGPAGVPSAAGPTPVPVRASLMRTRTLSGVQAVFVRERRAALAGYSGASRPHTWPDMAKFEGDLQTAREHAEGLLRGVERFSLVPIQVRPTTVHGTFYARTLNGRTIEIAERWSGDRPAYLASIQQATMPDAGGIRWHPAGTGSPQAIALHEFGHALADYVSRRSGYSLVSSRIRETVRLYAAERGLPDDKLIEREISLYAASNVNELIGEAFADAMVNGDAASVLSRRIMAVLVDEYDRTTGAAGRGVGPSLGRVLPSAPAPAVRIAERIREINTVPTTAPRQLRVRIKAELERQAQINPAILAEIRRVEIATQDIWDDMARRRLIDPNGFAAYHYTDHILYLSPRWATDRAALDRTIKGAFEQDNIAWSFPGYEMRNLDTAASVIRHEFGHITASRFPNEALGEIWTPQQIRQLVVPIAEELGVAPPLDTVTSVAEWFNSELVQRAVRTRVSSYATKSFNEMTAELWAVYSGRGTAASAIARRIGAILEARWAGLVPTPVAVEPGLARGVAEALQALTTGRTLAEVRTLLEALPEAKDALTIARRATTTQGLTRSLNALATRRGLTLPSAKELKAIQTAERAALVAERKAARAAAAEAARAVRAEKARQAAIKRQVKAVEQGELKHLTLVEKHAGGASYTDPAGGRWMVETFTSEADARERAVYASLQDLVTRDAADPPLRFAIGRGAPELRGGWQVAYPDLAMPPAGVGPSDWLAVPLARLQAATPAKIKALATKAGLTPDVGERLLAERNAAIVRARLSARRMPSRNAPPLTNVHALSQASFAEQAKWIDGAYGAGGLRAKVTDWFANPPTTIRQGVQPIVFQGEIRLRGKVVGEFERSYSYDAKGELVAYHETLIISPHVQGSGFAEQFNANLIDWYRRSGIKQVRLSANIDVGGYAWARAGYDFADQYAADDIAVRLRTIAGGSFPLGADARVMAAWARLDPAERQIQIQAAQDLLARVQKHPRFDDPLHPSAYEFSQLGRHAGQGKDDIWIGKATMLGSYWSAVLYL